MALHTFANHHYFSDSSIPGKAFLNILSFFNYQPASMSLYEFLRSGEMEQIEAFWNGVFIGERSSGDFKIECRQIDDFYVEYTILGGHYIDMCAFKNPELLQVYLDQIDISVIRDFMRG